MAAARTTHPAGPHGGARQAGQGDNVTLPKRGNSAAYRAARLKRDRPDIAARHAAGEFASVAAAWRGAGLEQPS